MSRRGVALEGAAVLLVVGLAAASALSGYRPGGDADFALGRSLPSAGHLLGTDHAGRDLLARLVHGAGAWLGPGAAAGLLTLAIGVPLGAVRGWSRAGARTWSALRGATGVLVSIPAALPAYVLLLLAGVSLGFSAESIGVVAGILGGAELAEALGGRLARESRAEYVEAALAEGASPARVLLRHLLWLQGRGLALRHALGAFPRVLLVEAALSALPPGGFGVKEPAPSWGNMLVRPMQDLVVAAPGGPPLALVWNALVPTVALVGAVALFGGLAERWCGRWEGRGR